jgi:hypothetical protein
VRERPQPEDVVGGDEVDRRAHDPGADRPTLQQQRREVLWVEPLEPRPEPDVGRERRLRLEADQVLDGVGGRGRLGGSSLEEPLPREQRAIERSVIEDGRFRHPTSLADDPDR